jgi:hypothetical protein
MLSTTESARIARINRRLAMDGYLQLRKTHGEQMQVDVGDFYIEDRARAFVVRPVIDLDDLERELGLA